MQTLWEDRPPAPGSASRIKITCHLERSPGSRSVELLFLICLIYHSISGKSFKLDTTCGLWPIVSFLKTVVKYTWQTLPASSSLRAQFGGTKYIHIAVQPSPPSVSRTSLSSQPATLSPLKTLTTQPLPPVPGTHHLLSVSVRLTPLGTSYGWNHIVFVLLCLDYDFFSVEVRLTKSNHFKVDNSTAFSAFAVLCNHHLYLVPKYFITPRGNPVPINSHSPSPDPQPLATSIWFKPVNLHLPGVY